MRLDSLSQIISVKNKAGQEISKVGVCGWVTPDTKFTSSPGPDINFSDVIPSVTACVADLNNQGVKIVMGIGHGGIDDDLVVAKSVPGKHRCLVEDFWILQSARPRCEVEPDFVVCHAMMITLLKASLAMSA